MLNKMHGYGFCVGLQQYTFNTSNWWCLFNTFVSEDYFFLLCRHLLGCALPQITLTHGLKMKRHFCAVCAVYNYAYLSLLLAELYLSSPGFLRASQPLCSSVDQQTPHFSFLPPLLPPCFQATNT